MSIVLLGIVSCQMGGCLRSSSRAGHPEAGVVSTADRRIRVRLAKDIPQFTLAVRGPCLIDDDQSHPLLEPLAELGACIVRPDPETPDGLLIGESRVSGPVMRVLPNRDGSLSYGDREYEDREYRGYLVVKREGDGFLVINVVDIESYLRGVLQGELPKYFHPETYRAQAIISRTYALYQRYVNGPQRAWDVTATTSSQVYHGKEGEGSKANEAVDDTAGLVCAWDSPEGRKIFCAYFSSTCGGMNQDVANVKGGPSVRPLEGGVICEYCKASDWYHWPTATISKEEITRAVKPFLVKGGYTHADKIARIESMQIVRRTKGGRAVRLRLVDKNGLTVDMRAEDFRLLINSGRTIKSTWFDVVNEANSIAFTNGRGFGHGIGMCQHGADGMARRGMKAGQILQHYYPGCVLVRAY